MSRSDSSVEDVVVEYIAKSKGLSPEERPGGDESLLQTGLIDSLGMMDLIAFLESTFGVTLDDDDLVPTNFETVTAIASLVRDKQSVDA